MDARNFYRKYLLDLAVDQHDSGLVPNLIPDPAKPRGGRSFFRSLAAKTAGAAGLGRRGCDLALDPLPNDRRY